ncbi:MAG: ABC transporter substrate-binding protein [Patescibacteria group bacterium]
MPLSPHKNGSWWRSLFFWRKAAGSQEFKPTSHSDHALVFAVTAPRRFPRFTQLRFLSRVFSTNELRLFYGALFSALVFLLLGAVNIVLPHLSATPSQGGTITEALIGTPKLINPLFASLNDVDQDLSTLIYSGLFRLDEHLNPQPDLVSSYRWLEEGKTLEVVLRTDAQFHDNIPLTAGDVVFTYQAIRDSNWRSPLAGLFRGVKVIRIDDQTVQFQLENADPTFTALLTIGILPAHIWEDVSESGAHLAEANIKPLGTGPYQVESFTRDAKGNILTFQLKRFEKYYGAAPYIDRWKFRFFPDQELALTALKNNQVDALAFIPWVEVEEMKTAGIRTATINLPQESVVFFNITEPVLKEERVRRALDLAIDREELRTLLDAHAVRLTSAFPFMESTSTTVPDLTAARTLLEESGWILKEDATIRTWKAPAVRSSRTSTRATPVTTPSSFTSTTQLEISISVPNQPDLLKLADLLQRRWSLLGIKVNVTADEAENLRRSSVTDHAYQVLVWNILLPATQDISPFWSGDSVGKAGFNFSQINDTAINTALAQLPISTSTEALTVARIKLSDAILAKTPAIFLLRPTFAYLISRQIKGVSDLRLATPSDRLSQARTWYIKTGWSWK